MNSKEFSAMARLPSNRAGQCVEAGSATGRCALSDVPVFDPVEFDELSDMIGEDGVAEMLHIFEFETRERLRRLSVGGQDTATQIREMHTLKGAAATVAATRLATLGLQSEQAARDGIATTKATILALEDALEGFLTAIRARNHARAPVF